MPRLPSQVLPWLLAGALLASGRVHALDPDKAFHPYVSDNWSIEAGLPQIPVRAMAQDRDG